MAALAGRADCRPGYLEALAFLGRSFTFYNVSQKYPMQLYHCLHCRKPVKLLYGGEAVFTNHALCIIISHFQLTLCITLFLIG